jgi:hypothetical protein
MNEIKAVHFVGGFARAGAITPRRIRGYHTGFPATAAEIAGLGRLGMYVKCDGGPMGAAKERDIILASGLLQQGQAGGARRYHVTMLVAPWQHHRIVLKSLPRSCAWPSPSRDPRQTAHRSSST